MPSKLSKTDAAPQLQNFALLTYSVLRSISPQLRELAERSPGTPKIKLANVELPHATVKIDREAINNLTRLETELEKIIDEAS
jgi:hypothetical protein